MQELLLHVTCMNKISKINVPILLSVKYTMMQCTCMCVVHVSPDMSMFTLDCI